MKMVKWNAKFAVKNVKSFTLFPNVSSKLRRYGFSRIMLHLIWRRYNPSKRTYFASESSGIPDWMHTDESLLASFGRCVHLAADIAMLKRYYNAIVKDTKRK